MSNLSIGALGEDLAADYLISQGYRIIQRNFRAKQYGEVDIIASKSTNLIFVEVKTRVGNQFGLPQEAITQPKLRELKKMVDYYYNLFPKTDLSPQIDVIAITLDTNLACQNLEHFANVTL